MHPTSLDTLQQELRAFLAETFVLGPEDELHEDTSLLGAGILDSTGVLEVVAYLETRYGIEIADEDIVPENMDSIQGLSRFVSSRLG